MYKLTIEKIDAQAQIEGKLVYLTEEEAALVSAMGVKVEPRNGGTYIDRDINERTKMARIPIPDFRRVVESKVYEQIVEDLDIAQVIKVINRIQ